MITLLIISITALAVLALGILAMKIVEIHCEKIVSYLKDEKDYEIGTEVKFKYYDRIENKHKIIKGTIIDYDLYTGHPVIEHEYGDSCPDWGDVV